MAEIAYVVDVNSARVKVVRWPSMANGDIGQPYAMSGWFPDKCVEVTGTFGTGGTLTVQGSNQFADPALKTPPATGAFKALADPQGTVLDIVAADPNIEQILENPYWIRPAVTAGDGTTALTAIICMKG